MEQQPSRRAVVEPGSPWWVRPLAERTPSSVGSFGQQLALTAIFLVAVCVIGALMFYGGSAGTVLAAALIAGLVGSTLVAYKYAADRTVVPGVWRYKGQFIDGAGMELLDDIIARFDYAHRMVNAVPTGIDWREVEPHVDALVWEATGHAARASQLEREAVDLRYADAGTPQRALLDDVKRRASEYLDAMRATQLEAEQLARLAGNAAAAAKLALARTGSIYELEVVAPTARAVAARDALAAAKERLKMLAEVWEELDETTAIKQQRLEGEGRSSP